ncbi:MAG: hypothetical protein Q8858_17265 [Bacteroidota bacterium]|nr:hypothetical protein [Bacteroidota bacterium]
MKKFLAIIVILCIAAAALGCGNKDIEGGRKALNVYLTSVKNGKYDEAYELLCRQDKEKISREAFNSWFDAVAEIQEVKTFKISSSADVFKNMTVYEDKYTKALGFTVTQELDKKIAGVEVKPYGEEEYKIMAAFENGEWKIFTGYEDLNTNTDKLLEAAEVNK